LSWYDPGNKNLKFSKEETIRIRESIDFFILCKNFSQCFLDLFKKVINRENNSVLIYSEIIEVFKYIKEKCKHEIDYFPFKFEWLKIFKKYIENKNGFDNNSKKEKIIKLFDKYCLNINNYMK
jgi:hypothetical protein